MPEIITRKAAMAASLTKYFTGKPCGKGHLSERYCKNGACQECLRPVTAIARIPRVVEGQIVSATDPRLELMKEKLAIDRLVAETNARALEIRAQNSAVRLQESAIRSENQIRRETRRFIKENMTTVFLMVELEDYLVAVSMVWTAALMRNPSITKEDVITGRRTNEVTYVFRCFPDDKKTLLETSRAIWSARHSASVAAAREQAIASAQAAEAAAIDAEWPEFRP